MDARHSRGRRNRIFFCTFCKTKEEKEGEITSKQDKKRGSFFLFPSLRPVIIIAMVENRGKFEPWDKK